MNKLRDKIIQAIDEAAEPQEAQLASVKDALSELPLFKSSLSLLDKKLLKMQAGSECGKDCVRIAKAAQKMAAKDFADVKELILAAAIKQIEIFYFG